MAKKELGSDFGCTETLQKEWDRLNKNDLNLAYIISCLSFTYGGDKVNKFLQEKDITQKTIVTSAE